MDRRTGTLVAEDNPTDAQTLPLQILTSVEGENELAESQRTGFRYWRIVAVFVVVALVGGGTALVAMLAMTTSKPEQRIRSWMAYSNQGGGYRIDFPGYPQEVSRWIETENGNQQLSRAFLTVGEVRFETGYYSLGKGRESEFTFDYHTVIKEALEDTHGRIVSETGRTLGPYVGIIVVLEHTPYTFEAALLIRRQNNVYLAVVQNYPPEWQEHVDRFLGSFDWYGSPGDAAADIVIDTAAPFRVVGNTWTHRTTEAGMGTKMSTKYTVRRVGTTECVLDVEHFLDDQRTMVIPASESTVRFNSGLWNLLGVGDGMVYRETIVVEAGTFDCRKIILKGNGRVLTQWVAFDSGLLVLEENTDGKSPSRIELTAFELK